MTTPSLLIHDATLIDAEGSRTGWLRATDGIIVAIGHDERWEDRRETGDHVIDARGAALTPGFIDLHGHGGAGVAYDDADAETIGTALAFHRAHGTTRHVLSLVSATIEQQEAALQRLAACVHADPLLLGIHLEGPYLAQSRRGAHEPTALTSPTAEKVARQLAAADGTLRMITMAPELPGATEAQELFQRAGVLVAVGHTDADYDTALAAFHRGARVLTHAFNAMPALLHRAPGPVMAAVDAGAVLEVILDGTHVHPSVAAAAFRLALGRVTLVTDAMSAAGCGNGDYVLGGLRVSMHDGIARLEGTDTLAGSTLTQDTALRIAVEEAGVNPAVAVAALTSIPADLLGRSDLGRLTIGARADLVLLDDRWNATTVIADGRIIAEHGTTN